MKIYRANILYTPTPEKFEILQRGYIAVRRSGVEMEAYRRSLAESRECF